MRKTKKRKEWERWVVVVDNGRMVPDPNWQKASWHTKAAAKRVASEWNRTRGRTGDAYRVIKVREVKR